MERHPDLVALSDGTPRHVAIQAPVVADRAVELAAPGSRIFRKQVLKVGSINYKGRKLDFTPEYLDGLTAAFQDKAFDSVPLVFADAANAHTQDPERIRGEVIGFERDGDRLDAIVRASNDKAAQLLRENPNIGVSVRIEQPLERADGKRFPAAIQHVLATANPRITGMAPWEPVDLAVGDLPVIDLSTLDFADGEDDAQKESDMADAPAAPFTPEQMAALQAMLAPNPADDAPTGEPELSDEELARIAAAVLAEDEQSTVDAPKEPVGAALANDNGEALELANARIDAQAIELAALKAENDQVKFDKLVESLTQDGVPPAVTELAKPLLLGTNVLELANGSQVDAGEVVRKVLVEFAKQKHAVELGRPVAYDESAARKDREDTENSRRDAAVYVREYGLV